MFSFPFNVIEYDCGICLSTGDPAIRRHVSSHRSLARALESMFSTGPTADRSHCIVNQCGRLVRWGYLPGGEPYVRASYVQP